MDGEYIDLHPQWTDPSSAPLHVNQFASQLSVPVGDPPRPDGIILSMGAVTPPLLVGDPSRFPAQVAALNGVLPIQTVARFALSRDRAVELIEVLQTTVAQHDAIQESHDARRV